jgi:N-acetyl-gamma-glutamyl-phosphate reductase
MTKRSLGIVGARGYVGKELIDLLLNGRHDGLDLVLSVSQRDGLSASDVAARALDAYVLALPNGTSAPFIAAIDAARPDAVIVDLSADHRFDEAWVYGQPERLRARIAGARRISNPGCYATAMQLAIAPLTPLLGAGGTISVFGVSGYSGSGTTPSPKNDPEALRDNLLPYHLVDHVHEREVAKQLDLEGRLFFAPHVAPFFRGITVTVTIPFAKAETADSLMARYEKAYANEALVQLSKEAPLVRDIAGKHHVAIGGLSVSEDGRHAVVVATIDNLLGGAATQALRNLNLALAFPERMGLPEEPRETKAEAKKIDAEAR